MPRVPLCVTLLLACVAFACNRGASSRLHVDNSIGSELLQIQAIDNHAHPMKVVSPGEEDHDYDALPADGIQDLALPTPFRQGSPYFPQAWHALFGYDFSDAKPEHIAQLDQAKRAIAKQKGDLYPVLGAQPG